MCHDGPWATVWPTPPRLDGNRTISCPGLCPLGNVSMPRASVLQEAWRANSISKATPQRKQQCKPTPQRKHQITEMMSPSHCSFGDISTTAGQFSTISSQCWVLQIAAPRCSLGIPLSILPLPGIQRMRQKQLGCFLVLCPLLKGQAAQNQTHSHQNLFLYKSEGMSGVGKTETEGKERRREGREGERERRRGK